MSEMKINKILLKNHLTETNMHCDSFNAPQHPKNAIMMTSVATPTNTSKPMYTSFLPWVSDTRSEVSVRAHPNRVNAAIPAACKSRNKQGKKKNHQTK